MAGGLDGKSAVITGGGTGIGWAIAQTLAAAGCRVAISGRREEVLRQSAGSWTGPTKILYSTCDVADRASVDRFFTWAKEQLGPIDILVSAAGLNIKTRSMAAMTPDQWDYVMQVNSTGVYNCMHAVLPAMRERHDGLIVNISSTSGLRAAPLGGVAYNASKFAVRALGIGVGGEVAPEGVRVTNIYPGEVNTPILEHRPQPVSEERKAKMLLPQDVADMVLAVALLPPRAHVPELTIKPLAQDFV